MFKLGFTKNDAVRSVWAFVFPFAVAFAAGVVGIARDYLTSCSVHCDAPVAKAALLALAIGVGSSLLAAVKNFVLADSAPIKG